MEHHQQYQLWGDLLSVELSANFIYKVGKDTPGTGFSALELWPNLSDAREGWVCGLKLINLDASMSPPTHTPPRC